MRKTDFTKALTEYFSIYLPTTCGVSPNTTNSYRDTFKQLLLFFQEKKGISANYIELRYLNMELVSEFLDWLETSRHIAVTTRNQRLAAIKAFAHFVQYKFPENIENCVDIINLRPKKYEKALLFGKVSYYTMDTGSRIKLVREHRGLTQQKLGEMLGYGKSSANRIAQYEMGYRSPKANRLKEIAKAMNIREEIFLMPDETPIDLLRILIWYDWEHEGVLQLATSRTANTPPGKTVSPIIYSEQLPLNRLLLDWADKKHSLSVRKITRADYLEWMLQWPPRLP